MTIKETNRTDIETAFQKIRERSLFNMIPLARTPELLSGAEVFHVRTGARVPRRGRPDTIWIVIAGKIGLVLPELVHEAVVEETVISGRSIELKTLFLQEIQWRREWVALDDSQLLAVKFSDFRNALSQEPALEDYLIKITCYSELHRFKNDLRFFGVPNSELPLTMRGMKKFSFGNDKDSKNFSEAGIFVVARGQINAFRADHARDFSTGDYFPWDPSQPGGKLTGSPDCEVWWMGLTEWQRNVPKSPVPEISRLIDAFAHGQEPAKTLAPLPTQEPQILKTEEGLPSSLSGTIETKNEPREESSRLLVYFRLFFPNNRLLIEILCIAALARIFFLSIPLYTKYVFDSIGVPGGFHRITYAGVVAMISTGLLSVMYISYHRLGNYLRGSIEAKFGPLFLGHVYRMPLRFFGKRQVGDITSRLGDLVVIRDAFVGSVPEIVEFAFLVSINLIALCTFSFWIAVAVVSIAILMTIIMTLLFRVLAKSRREFQDAVGRSHSLVFEQFNALENLRSLGASVAARWRWEYARLEVLHLQADTQLLQAFIGGLAEFFGEIAIIAALITGVFLHLKGKISVGQLIAANALVLAVVNPITLMVESWRNIGQVTSSIRRIDEIMSLRTEATTVVPIEALPKHIDGSIELENVVFRYETSDVRPALNGISLKINGGETVAFVGHSGSGKSTLAYLVSRLRQADSGKIKIDGKDIYGYPLKYLRERIGLVIQENSIFSGSILDNIAGGVTVPSSAKVMRAAQLAGAHSFISRLPLGYASELGEGGSGLSSGQRQKLNIARALYRDPDILILDEATSTLDGASEDLIMDNLQHPGKKRTTIIIAHRLNTVEQADRIFVFDQGKLIESGTHIELLNLDGKYADLYRSQRS